MLGVTPIGSQPPSLAPPPVQPVPSWINAAPPGFVLPGFEVASNPALLQAIIQRGYERLASGEITLSSRDLVAALRLHAHLEALAHRSEPDASEWQNAMVEILSTARKHLGSDRFRDFLADVSNARPMRGLRR
jgi:hypothetical protein